MVNRCFFSQPALITCLLFFSAHPVVVAQNKIASVNRVWLNYVGQFRWQKKWNVMLDLNYRARENFIEGAGQILIRPSLMYQLNNQARLSVGLAYVETAIPYRNSFVFRDEYRPWQQFQYQLQSGSSTLVNRIRLEQRFQSSLIKDGLELRQMEFNWRIRYLFSYELSIVERQGHVTPFSILANNEVMFNAGKTMRILAFDQNRFFIGAGYRINRSNQLQLGYMNLFQHQSGPFNFLNAQVIRLNYVQSLDLRNK